MKENWKFKKLGDVCNFQGGSQPPKSTFSTVYKEGYIRLIQIRDYKSDKHIVFIPKDKARRFCTEDDVMIGRYGPPVFQILRGLEGAYNVALMKATPDESQLTKDFLFHFLKSPKVQQYVINLSARAAGQTGLNKETIEPYLIPLPPLHEQKRIVAILDEAFEGIDRAIANTKKNLTNARELFESYLNVIFTQKGDGWIEKQLGDIAELIDSLHKTPSYIDEGGFPMVRVTDIKDGVLNLTNARRVDEATFVEFSKRHTPKLGDIVFSRVGSYGVPALVQSDVLFCLGQNTVFIIPKIDSQLLYFFLRSPNSQEQIEKFVAGTTQGTISLRSIKLIRVPIPPSSEQVDLAANLNSVLIETQRLEAVYQQKLAALNELKQSILQKAFTGELTVDTTNQTTKATKEVVAA